MSFMKIKMAVWTRCTLALLLMGSIWTCNVAAEATTKIDIGPKKILVLLPINLNSHQIVFSAVINELLNRGHHVTIISARPQKEKHPLLREIRVGDPLEKFVANTSKERFQSPQNTISLILMALNFGPLYNNPIFESSEALSLKGEKFDLVITEAFFFQEPLLGFAHHFGCPSVALNPIGYFDQLNYFTGGAVNPAYVPSIFGNGGTLETVFGRLTNTLSMVFWMLMYQFVYLPDADALLRKEFPDAPPIEELIKNISLTLLNSNNALMPPVPLAPSVIEVGGLHIKPGKPLQADLKKWMDDSKEGIVYFSLGSTLQPGLLPDHKKLAVFASLGKLKQNVLVKWNAEIPSNAPKNCRFEEWLPQQEVLAHPNIQAFVTQGGLLSIQEAVYFGVPMVVLPVISDQPFNAHLVTERGIAVASSIHDFTTDTLDAALDEVINNPRYRMRAKELSLRFRLDPMKPREKAVYYIEQLMKLGDFKYLQPKSVNLRWYQYMLLDVLAVVVITLYITYRIISCLCGLLLRYFCKSSKAKND